MYGQYFMHQYLHKSYHFPYTLMLLIKLASHYSLSQAPSRKSEHTIYLQLNFSLIYSCYTYHTKFFIPSYSDNTPCSCSCV